MIISEAEQKELQIINQQIEKLKQRRAEINLYRKVSS